MRMRYHLIVKESFGGEHNCVSGNWLWKDLNSRVAYEDLCGIYGSNCSQWIIAMEY
ncbi:hypothetical protein RchiOBHm_Chr5g0046271 [Rosa chinensis]|uniref:Uncharacterized protein n=1 Tax=Rosa chinensis TaxID=74649 RepID=A0A2P6QE10_ROSCH|nr:hypothetical protein RchiOBHm_Chr5g0046271 [Rosa chinensis]